MQAKQFTGKVAVEMRVVARVTGILTTSSSRILDVGYTCNGFIPIGREANENAAFTGSFNGNGFTISNLYSNISYSNISGRVDLSVGLFGVAQGGGATSEIRNVTMENITIVATSSSSFRNVYSGGIVGQAIGNTITNSHFSGDISVSSPSVSYSGGIVGNTVAGSITNSRFIGGISANLSGTNYSGGIIGSTTTKALLQ